MLRNKASSSNGHKITSNPANKWFFLCHDNFLEWMSVNFCVSNVWDIKCELGRPMNSHVVVPVSMIPFLFTYFFLLLYISV